VALHDEVSREATRRETLARKKPPAHPRVQPRLLEGARGENQRVAAQAPDGVGAARSDASGIVGGHCACAARRAAHLHRRTRESVARGQPHGGGSDSGVAAKAKAKAKAKARASRSSLAERTAAAAAPPRSPRERPPLPTGRPQKARACVRPRRAPQRGGAAAAATPRRGQR